MLRVFWGPCQGISAKREHKGLPGFGGGKENGKYSIIKCQGLQFRA